MAAQPEEAAQTAGLNHPSLVGKNMTATEMKRNQRSDELPCRSNCAPWKECFYEKVQQRSLNLQEKKVKMIQAQKAEEEKVKKREPCDWLCKEWFSDEKESLDTCTYLLDKLLPTLIPGVEKLLMQVERKNVLVPDKEPTKFDPITFLGEYLMRHNPQYDISTKPGPYLRGMKMVTEELKTEMADTAPERLARMKAEAKTKRKEREQVENMKSEQKEMRKEALAIQFKEWTVDISGRIPVALIQSALRSFLDVVASAPMDVREAIYDRKLEIIDTLEQKVNIDEFTEYVHSYTENFSNDMFQEILKHLHQCALDFQKAIRCDMWRQMFTDLFLDCDYGKVGLLDRQKILALLEEFYDRSPMSAKRRFCNPRQWPIIELQEIELADFWGDLHDQEVCEELSENLVLSQAEISEGEILPCEPVGDNSQGSYEMSTSVSEGPLEQMDMSEAETGGISKEEKQAAESSDAEDAPVAEAVKETAARKESSLSEHSSQFGQQTSSETRLQDEDLQDQGKDLRPIMADIQNRCTSRVRSAFDEHCLNLPQFVQLMETFVGQDIPLPTVKSLIEFIKEEYKQTKESKTEQLEKVRRTSRLAHRKLLLEALFEKWDKNASGFLDLKEVDAVLSTFKEGMEKEALRKAKSHFSSCYPQSSRVEKLSPEAFQTFLELVASEFTGDEDEVIDNIVEFLTTSVERSWMECLQSLTRRKWLHNIQQAAEMSGASMEPVYKAVFKALSQDAEAHGDNKKISAYIALLEENQLSPERGQILLHYVACTTDDAPYVLNQILYKDMKGVSFAAVEEGKPTHVPRVQLHGNIHFWNYDRPVEERRGSLLVLPLQDAHWNVFGILGIDTLRDQSEKTIFLTHEISFCQGVSLAFSKAYHHVCALENVLQMTLTALNWLYPRVPSIHTVTTYLVEPGKHQTCDYALRKMITTDNTEQKEIHTSAVLFLRKENLLRDYLFKCIDTSEVVCTSVCGEHHIAVPLRDLSRQAFGLFDISIGHHQKLPPHEYKDLQKMLKMAQAACCEILKIPSEETKPTYVLEAEHMNSRHAGILFHRFMLQDLRECVQKLGAESFAEIKGCEEPPALIHNIVKAVLLLFNPNWKGSEKIESWSQCILNLDDNLIQEIYCFDPTAPSVQVQGELLLDCIGGVPRAELWKQGSVPSEYLYNWVHTCLALMEMTKSLQNKEVPDFTSKV
ncbi:EF-hand calcium-binding domain-containing protein 5 [Aythya fuligula]|uniref:EF-hand calcium-binding domain-containing protein 5 n=1 Tax=Aythya fuligula TaxID=219594 RepID=A0A6J3E4Y2_AYTFU|nr:EF-hand calcium-binding domain-containing protein 5 [Aythya fuligula]